MVFSNQALFNDMHTPYEKALGHKCDFRVKYRFFTTEEGGRLSLPYQGIRSDFWYDRGDNSFVIEVVGLPVNCIGHNLNRQIVN
jgi:hypothetical protein